MKRAPLIGSTLLLVASLAACNRQAPAAARCNQEDAGMPVDPILLAFLSRARAAHHLADDQESAGDLSAALQPLVELAAGPLPHPSGGKVAPEVREVLADTRARLGDLHSRLGAYDQAIRDVQAGLEQAPDPNYFRGHLLETEGLVEERRAKALEVSDPSASKAARQRAIELLEQAMAVQARVLQAPSSEPAAPGITAPSATPPALNP